MHRHQGSIFVSNGDDHARQVAFFTAVGLEIKALNVLYEICCGFLDGVERRQNGSRIRVLMVRQVVTHEVLAQTTKWFDGSSKPYGIVPDWFGQSIAFEPSLEICRAEIRVTLTMSVYRGDQKD